MPNLPIKLTFLSKKAVPETVNKKAVRDAKLADERKKADEKAATDNKTKVAEILKRGQQHWENTHKAERNLIDAKRKVSENNFYLTYSGKSFW